MIISVCETTSLIILQTLQIPLVWIRYFADIYNLSLKQFVFQMRPHALWDLIWI